MMKAPRSRLALAALALSLAVALPSTARAAAMRNAGEPHCSTASCEKGKCTACGDFTMTWCDLEGNPVCNSFDWE